MEKELKIRDIEHLTIPQMVELAQVKICDALLLIDTALDEAEPQTGDAKGLIGALEDFNWIFSRAYDKVEDDMWVIARTPTRRGK